MALDDARKTDLRVKDLVVHYQPDGDEGRDAIASGDELALALALAWRHINYGMGTWSVFTDPEDIAFAMRGLAQLIWAASDSSHDLEGEALTFIGGALRDLAGRLEALKARQTISECRVHIRRRNGRLFRNLTALTLCRGSESPATQCRLLECSHPSIFGAARRGLLRHPRQEELPSSSIRPLE
jgi:hypothetical protein